MFVLARNYAIRLKRRYWGATQFSPVNQTFDCLLWGLRSQLATVCSNSWAFMTFRPRNAYYLRISANLVLPLFLYLDERHIDWMSDVVLQHVLADLRPLVIPKLEAEKDVHFGIGAAPGTKRGTVEVHRGETYQFAYFFRKTEPHTVLFKSRHFVTAPLRPEIVSRRAPQVSVKRSKRKRAKTKGKGKGSQRYLDEDEWSPEESEDDMDVVGPISTEPLRVRKQRRIIIDAQEEDDDGDVEDVYREVAMESLPPEMGGVFPGDSAVSVVDSGDAISRDANDEPRLSPDTADVALVVEEEEMKPKPLLKLKYQSFSISGHCLCVVVEPWPSQRAESRLRSVGLGTSLRRESLELHPSNKYIIGQRAETPLFFPDHDRQPSEAPFARESTIPPVPLFHDTMSGTEDDDGGSDDGLMNFSQALNAAGHMHAITADDDDDMDGAVLFGDADEVRELT